MAPSNSISLMSHVKVLFCSEIKVVRQRKKGKLFFWDQMKILIIEHFVLHYDSHCDI